MLLLRELIIDYIFVDFKQNKIMELSQEITEALKVIWKDYFSPDDSDKECIDRFKRDLKSHMVDLTISDIISQKLKEDIFLTEKEQKAYSVLIKEQSKYPNLF